VRLAFASRKPIFVVSGFRNDQPELSRFHQRAMSEGQTVMPAFGMRYTPATCRLRELIATCLGPAQSLSLTIAPSAAVGELSPIGAGRDQLIAAADWCRYVVGTAPTRVAGTDTSVQLEFPGKAGGANVKAELSFTSQLPADAGSYPIGTEMTAEAQFQAVVHCVRGTATLRSVTEIDWEQGGDSARESLTSERTATEVMFDLFCRRVVGGLIPVADISDVVRCAQVVDAFRQSVTTARHVDL
jgi:predicted dehydrogenase